MIQMYLLLSDIYHGRGNGGESIYGPVFEGKCKSSYRIVPKFSDS